MNARRALLGSLTSLLLATTPAHAADPHDIIGGLIGLGIIANAMDNDDDYRRVEHRDDYDRRDYGYRDYGYRDYGYRHDDHGYRAPVRHGHRHREARIGGHEARELCERALYREKSNYVLRDIDNFDYDRRRGEYSMLLEARKHGHGKYRSYWCQVDAWSGRTYLDRAG